MATTYNTQVIELLSLGNGPEGPYQIKVGVNHPDRQASYVIDIDEFTYLQMDALKPLNGNRVRISPYAKWNPYRNTYYCTMVRSSGHSSETLYFACSEEFIGLIREIRNGIEPPENESDQVSEPQAAEEFVQPRPRRSYSKRLSRLALRLSMICVLLIFLPFGFDGSYMTDGAENISGHIGEARAAATDDGWKGVLSSPLPLSKEGEKPNGGVEERGQLELTAGAPAEAAADQTKSAPAEAPSKDAPKAPEVMDINGDKSFFGLPEGYVALTFDDGPSPLTQKIVDILTEQGVAATFLFVGKNAAHNPDAVTYASEHGMAVGNHSWDHSVLTKAGPAEQAENLADASKILESLTGSPVTLFRPPYGSIDKGLVSKVKEQHMKVLMWNRDPEDWKAKTPEDIVRYFRELDSSGGVYVLHEDKNTVGALPDIIEYLKGKNLKFTTFK